jgi:hypothetical protein
MFVFLKLALLKDHRFCIASARSLKPCGEAFSVEDGCGCKFRMFKGRRGNCSSHTPMHGLVLMAVCGLQKVQRATGRRHRNLSSLSMISATTGRLNSPDPPRAPSFFCQKSCVGLNNNGRRPTIRSSLRNRNRNRSLRNNRPSRIRNRHHSRDIHHRIHHHDNHRRIHHHHDNHRSRRNRALPA